MTETAPSPPNRPSVALRRAQAILAGLSLALCLAIGACYATRPTSAVLVTTFPVWAWLFPGLLVLAPSHSAPGRRRTLLIAGAWVLMVLAFAEEPRTALTGSREWPDPGWNRARAAGDGLRVVTANCAGGNADVAREALVYGPDILLLQESPSAPELSEAVGEHLNCAFVWGLDASVVVHGKVRRVEVGQDDRGFVTVADAEVAGRTVRVIATRLLLPYCEPDLWRPGAWRSAGGTYRARAEQMHAIRRYLAQTPAARPVIVGGDFNAPAGDRLVRALRPRLRDAYPERPIGLGNTIINEFPFSRIDQVWVSPDFGVHAVLARKTEHSDHRLVVCDLSLRGSTR